MRCALLPIIDTSKMTDEQFESLREMVHSDDGPASVGYSFIVARDTVDSFLRDIETDKSRGHQQSFDDAAFELFLRGIRETADSYRYLLVINVSEEADFTIVDDKEKQ